MTLIAEFFAYARERHAVYLRRASGAPAPWTEDPILQQYRFCNVFRELDTTTVWFRENVRDPLRDKPEVLLATVVFRLFNRITTGEAIFLQSELFTASSAWACFLASNNGRDGVKYLRQAILNVCGSGPYTTGSYMTKTPAGLNKLDGMLKVVEWFVEGKRKDPDQPKTDWRMLAEDMIGDEAWSLELCWEWLSSMPFIGDFTAYEIVTDLRHTALLENAPDINTWANPGPGAKRGLNVMHGRPLKSGVRRDVYIEEMMLLLEASRDPQYWPQPLINYDRVFEDNVFDGYTETPDLGEYHAESEGDWPAWELREVEHTLCEFFKYERVRTTGQGTRQRFRGGV